MTLNRSKLTEESCLEGTFQVVPCSSSESRIGCTSKAPFAASTSFVRATSLAFGGSQSVVKKDQSKKPFVDTFKACAATSRASVAS